MSRGASYPTLVSDNGSCRIYCSESRCRIQVPADTVSLVNVERALSISQQRGLLAKIRSKKLKHCDCIIATLDENGRLNVVVYELKSGSPLGRGRQAVNRWASSVAEKLLVCSALARDIFSWANPIVECRLAIPSMALGGNVLAGGALLWENMRRLIQVTAKKLGVKKNKLFCNNYNKQVDSEHSIIHVCS